jgi:hypothetical protein
MAVGQGVRKKVAVTTASLAEESASRELNIHGAGGYGGAACTHGGGKSTAPMLKISLKL